MLCSPKRARNIKENLLAIVKSHKVTTVYMEVQRSKKFNTVVCFVHIGLDCNKFWNTLAVWDIGTC